MRITYNRLKEIANNVGLEVRPMNGFYYLSQRGNSSRTLCSGTASECWHYCNGYGDGKRDAVDQAMVIQEKRRA